MQIFKGRTITERGGYVSLEKRLVQLQLAGINTRIAHDEMYDVVGVKGFPPPPPLPRHFHADLADVSELDRQYRERRREIEDHIKSERARKAGVQGTSPVNPADKQTENKSPEKAG